MTYAAHRRIIDIDSHVSEPAPLPGADTALVLQDLGLGEPDIARLRSAGVI